MNNKAFLPPFFNHAKEMILVVTKYCIIKNKSVVVLLTQHSKSEANTKTGKLEIIHSYNVNKGWFDTLDRLVRYNPLSVLQDIGF